MSFFFHFSSDGNMSVPRDGCEKSPFVVGHDSAQKMFYVELQGIDCCVVIVLWLKRMKDLFVCICLMFGFFYVFVDTTNYQI